MIEIRHRIRDARRDVRGVALQTVIVIVVLLVIAGSVSAVLLSRSSDVVGQLEAQGVGALSEANCPITRVGGENGQVVTGAKVDGATITAEAGSKICFWQGRKSDGADAKTVAELDTPSPAQCFAAAGATQAAAGTVGGEDPDIDDKAGCAAPLAA